MTSFLWKYDKTTTDGNYNLNRKAKKTERKVMWIIFTWDRNLDGGFI